MILTILLIALGVYFGVGLLWTAFLLGWYFILHAKDDTSGDVGLAVGAGVMLYFMPWHWPELFKCFLIYRQSRKRKPLERA